MKTNTNKECKIHYHSIKEIKFYSFGMWDIRREKVYFLDCKMPAHTPRDAIALYNVIFSKIPFWNGKRLNKKVFEYPSQEWVLRFIKRVFVFELANERGKTVRQFRLIDSFDIDEIINKFPKFMIDYE